MLVINPLVCIDFQVELLLDKLKQKGAIRRALFLHNRSPGHSKNMTISRGGQMQCEELIAYLRVRHTFMFLIFLCIIFSSEWFFLSVKVFLVVNKQENRKMQLRKQGFLKSQTWVMDIYSCQVALLNYDKCINWTLKTVK